MHASDNAPPSTAGGIDISKRLVRGSVVLDWTSGALVVTSAGFNALEHLQAHCPHCLQPAPRVAPASARGPKSSIPGQG